MGRMLLVMCAAGAWAGGAWMALGAWRGEPPEGAGDLKSAGEVLDAVEAAGARTASLAADVRYVKTAGTAEGRDVQTRVGRVYYQDRRQLSGEAFPSEQGLRALAIDFTSLVFDNQRREERQVYIIAGDRVVEKLPDERLMNVYRLGENREEGKRFDPLRIGEGPLPVPIGQTRADVESRFKVELVPGLETLPVEKMKTTRELFENSYQLRLTPRAGTEEARDIREVRLWYRKEGLVPLMGRKENVDGGSDEFLLRKVKINEGVPPGTFDTAPPAGWAVQEKDAR